MTDSLKFPRGTDHTADDAEPLGTAEWLSHEDIEELSYNGPIAASQNSFLLGTNPYTNAPLGVVDDRHVVLVAGSRSGKGTDVIIPNLLNYQGSAFCIDPKGELYRKTAAYRGQGTSAARPSLGQDVRVLDPFGADDVPENIYATFNPLDLINADDPEAIDVADIIADSLIVVSNAQDAHWDETARGWIQALILLVATVPIFEGRRNLVTIKRLSDGIENIENLIDDLMSFDAEEEEATITHGTPSAEGIEEYRDAEGEALDWETPDEATIEDEAENSSTPIDNLLLYMLAIGQRITVHAENMEEAVSDVIGAAANSIMQMGEQERGSVFSTVSRNLKFLQSPQIQANVKETNDGWSLDDLKTAPNGLTLYLVLPQRYMSTHARWLRMIISLMIARMETVTTPPRTGAPVLAVLDEFNVLGHLKPIETSAGYMAGFNLKLFIVLQDLSQLKRHYKDTWETFLGNAGTMMAFGNTDTTTLEYLSKRLGQTSVYTKSTTDTDGTTFSTTDPGAAAKLEKGGRGLFGVKDLDESMQSVTTTRQENRSELFAVAQTPLMSSDEVARYFARDPYIPTEEQFPIRLLVFLSGLSPMAVNRNRYFQDPRFKDRYQDDTLNDQTQQQARIPYGH